MDFSVGKSAKQQLKRIMVKPVVFHKKIECNSGINIDLVETSIAVSDSKPDLVNKSFKVKVLAGTDRVIRCKPCNPTSAKSNSILYD